MNLQTLSGPTRKELGRFLSLPWWRWWGKAAATPSNPVGKTDARQPSRRVIAVENGWNSEPQDVPLFVQRFVTAVAAQEDSDSITTVEWWELFMDPDDETLNESFRQLLLGVPSPLPDIPAVQSIPVTTQESGTTTERAESIAFFGVTGQGTRFFIGQIPGTYAWAWGCCLWATEM